MLLPLLIFIIAFNVIPDYKTTVKAPPDKTQSIYTSPEVKKIQAFLKSKNSPLASASADFVIFGDNFGIPPEILVSISGQESTFGKHTPSCAKYNPFGITSSTSPCGHYRFKDYREAIHYTAKLISTSSYYADYRKERTIVALAKTYNNGSESWQRGVNHFLNQYDLQNKN